MRYSTILASGLTLLAAALLFSGCGTGGKDALSAQSSAPTFDELKARLDAEFVRLGIDPDKVVAQAPSGDGNTVFDLAGSVIDPDGSGGNPPTGIALSFTERAIGDYDQNGEVNVADLTPLGLRYQRTLTYDDPSAHGGIAYWPTGNPDDDGGAGNPPAAGSAAINWRNARIDGDDNGELNIADLTPIAMHWNERLNGYKLYRKGPSDTSFRLVQKPGDPQSPVSLSRPTIDPNRPVRYTFTDAQTADGIYEYYVTAYDIGGTNEGAQSVHVTVEIDTGPPPANFPPVAALTVNPSSGDEPLIVDLDASGSTDSDGTIVKYEWDWEGNGSYDFDSGTDSTVQHTYDVAGTYNPVVKVTDDDAATDTETKLVTVNTVGPNQDPTAVVTTTPDSPDGNAPLDVSFDGSGSSDPDGTIVQYEWDWTNDGVYDETTTIPTTSHTYTIQGNYQARLRVTDNRGGTDTALTPHNIVVRSTVESAPTAVLVADPTTGVAPLTVNFDASGSFDDGSIVNYEWDFDGDGTFNEADNTELSFQGNNTASYTYTVNGLYNPTVRVTDNDALTGTDSEAITLEIHGWYIITIDKLGNTGKYNSVAIINGNPAVAYQRVGTPPNAGLFYIRANNADGTSWPAYAGGTDHQIDSYGGAGKWTSLQDVGGQPAISYFADVYEGTETPEIRYIRATDADGTAWSPYVVVDNTVGTNSGHTSMAMVNGNPALCYYQYSPGEDLYYVRASDSTGSIWPTPTSVYTADIAGEFSNLLVVNGNPAIAFRTMNTDSGEMRYIRATDSSGASWGSAVIIDPGVPRSAEEPWRAGYQATMAIVNGNPAVAYEQNKKLDPNLKQYFCRANDASGTSWGSPQVLAATGVNAFSSLSYINNKPVISYIDGGDGYLKLRSGSDQNGTAFDTPESVTNQAGIDGGYTHALTISGRTAVVYYDGRTGPNILDLKIAIYFP